VFRFKSKTYLHKLKNIHTVDLKKSQIKFDGLAKTSVLRRAALKLTWSPKGIQNSESRRKTKISQFELFGDELPNQVRPLARPSTTG